jgi:murein DD-endopeptidase MepM/ murein hydrolase activator NlpD
MTKATRLLAGVLVGALLAPTTAAAAGDPAAEREQVRQRRAVLSGELDHLDASDDVLAGALEELEAQLADQRAAVRRAEDAAEAAEEDLAEARRSLTATRLRVADLTDRLVGRAVNTFINPSEPSFEDVLRSRDLGEAVRKDALMGELVARDDELVDALELAEARLVVEEEEASDAAVRAGGRREEAEDRLGELRRSREEKDRLRAALDQRRGEVLAEVSALEASDAALTAIIQAYEAQQAAAAAAAAAAARASGGGGGGASAFQSPPPAGGGQCRWPAAGRVTSEYGRRWGRLHAGIDIAAPTGTPIGAAIAGTVIYSGWQSGYGNVVIVSHGGGLSTLYGHQSRLGVSLGEAVGAGQIIGYVGSTGHSTGPHVHFETRYGGVARNPRGCLG